MHAVLERHLLTHQFSIFDPPEKVERIKKNLAREELTRFNAIAAKQFTRRSQLEPWVRRGIVRGFGSLYLPTNITLEAWLIAPLKSLNGYSPLKTAENDWNGMTKWMRQARMIPKAERTAYVTEVA